jgi:hypothetical protein
MRLVELDSSFPPLPAPAALPPGRMSLFSGKFQESRVGMECDASGAYWATGAFNVTDSWQGGLGGAGCLLR